MDDNGESYWIFESRDVRIHLSNHHFCALNALRPAFTACQSCRLSVSASLLILDCLSGDLNCLEILLDCAIRLPSPLAWSFFRLPAQVQPIVSGAHCIVYFPIQHPLQIYPYRHACPSLQCYKRNWIHLCVRILYILSIGLIAFGFFFTSDRDAKKRWAHNVVSSNWSMGGLGGQMLTGVVKNSVGRVFGS